MKLSTKTKLIHVLKTISSILEKCGGQGGTPGPCPNIHPNLPIHPNQTLKSGSILKPIGQSPDGIWRYADGSNVPLEFIKN